MNFAAAPLFTALGLWLTLLCGSVDARAAATQTVLSFVPASQVGEKPQSKLWQHGGTWWAALASDENDPKKGGVEEDGLWLFRLDGTKWTPVLMLASQTSYGAVAELFKADALEDGNDVHVLLHYETTSTQADFAVLVSLTWDAKAKSYKRWPTRASDVRIELGSSEIATIALDGKKRLWLATDQNKNKQGQPDPKIKVLYADAPYAEFKLGAELSGKVKDDDISAITTLPDGSVGVLWSNQNKGAFEYRTHKAGDPPNVWSKTETITRSVLPCGTRTAFGDDHVNLAVGSDGVVYAAVKTTYDHKDCPALVLLSRSTKGSWTARTVSQGEGTRPIVVVRPSAGRLYVFYTDKTGGGNIVYKGANLSDLDFSKTAPKLVFEGTHDDVTSTREAITTEVVVVANGGREGKKLTF